jgi:hypothetical protein
MTLKSGLITPQKRSSGVVQTNPQAFALVLQIEISGRVISASSSFDDLNSNPNELKSSPAMAVRVSDRLWFIKELDLRDRSERYCVKEIRVLHRGGHRTAQDVTNCVGCFERSGISAHSRKEQPEYGTVIVNKDSDKDRALQILRLQGFEVAEGRTRPPPAIATGSWSSHAAGPAVGKLSQCRRGEGDSRR